MGVPKKTGHFLLERFNVDPLQTIILAVWPGDWLLLVGRILVYIL